MRAAQPLAQRSVYAIIVAVLSLPIAHVAIGNSEIQVWLLILVPLVVGGLPLIGVWLGSQLDRRARQSERQAAEYTELRKDASDVIGSARVVLTAMEPSGYAAWAKPELNDEIDKRRQEADLIRPRLAALAVRWPDAALELNAVERHLGTMPTRLSILVQRVLNHDEFTAYLQELTDAQASIVDALDRAIQKLADGGTARASG